MMCVFNGYVGEKNNALNFFFLCPGINHSDMNNQEFEFVEINYPGMNSTHTGCIGFQKAKKLATSNLVSQAFKGFIRS